MKKKKGYPPATTKYGDFQMYGTNIRFRQLTYRDPLGDVFNDYEVQTYGAPYFFGLFRKRKWESQIITNELTMGIHWCKHLLEAKNIPLPPKE